MVDQRFRDQTWGGNSAWEFITRLALDANTMHGVWFDGTVQVFFFRKPENESSYYIPKITVVLHHFVFSAQKALVPLFWLLTYYKPWGVSEKQKRLALIRCSLCLRQACMTCAIANECQCVNTYMQRVGGGLLWFKAPIQHFCDHKKKCISEEGYWRLLLSTWTINFFKKLQISHHNNENYRCLFTFVFCKNNFKKPLVFVDYRVAAGGTTLFWIGTLKMGSGWWWSTFDIVIFQ